MITKSEQGQIRLRAKQQKVGHDKVLAFVTRPMTYNTLGEDAMLELMARDSGMTRSQLELGFEAYKTQFLQMLLNGHSLQLGNLGFVRLSLSAKAVKNKENVSASLIRYYRLLFRPSSALRARLASLQFIMDSVIEIDPDNN